MHLKKVEICGFKSFADKTELNFEHGISGIIGPNGCGKSNIVDSIRWCLGEQKARTMRSSNMQEVIFGGSQTRPTTGMAEVSLVFDNSQNVLPINYPEVTIVRRLFKSGESEYFINKTQCRLKDIRDMFLDTGIGAEGYSVIEQGKVDFLIAAKPEDRRELFEEAAGVSKYKARREETIKRLEKIDEDMFRLSDTLTIHKQQITALDVAAKKAKQYKKYQEDLTKYEIASLVENISCNYREIARIQSELDSKTNEFEIENTIMTQFDAEIQGIRVTVDTQNEQYVDANKDLSEIKIQVSVADQTIQHAMQRETEVKSEQEKLEHELIVNRSKIVQMEEQLKTFSTNDKILLSEVEKLEKVYKEKEEQYNLIKSKLVEFELKKGDIRLKLSTFESEKKDQINLKIELSDARIHLNADVASLQRIITRLESDIELTNREITFVETELVEANKLLQSLEAKKGEVSKVVIENEKKLKEFEKLLSCYKEDLASNETRIATLKEFDHQDPVRASIRAVLGLGNIARGPISSLINAQDDKDELVALALGEKLNYLVCNTINEAEQAIRFLEENGLSRLSFIVSEKIKDFKCEPNVEFPAECTELIKCLRYDPEEEKIVRFVCSDMFVLENKIYGDAVVQGGGKISFEKPVLIEDQITKLSLGSQKLKQNILYTQTEIEHTNEFQINFKVEMEKCSFDLVKIKTQIEGNYARIEEKRNSIKDIVEEINKHKKEITIKNTEIASFSERITIFDMKLADYEKEENKFYEELKIVENSIFSVRKEEEFIAATMMGARSDWDKKSAEIENEIKGRQYLVDNIDNLKHQVQYDERKITESNEKLAELLALQKTETINLQQLYKSQTQKELEIQNYLTEKQKLQDELDVKTGKWHDLTNKVDGLRNDLNSRKVDLKNFEYQKNDMENRLAQTYGKNYEEIKNDFNDVEIEVEEIEKMKKKIESLGSVNLAAQEEFDALEQRYNFILTQQQDLLKAKNDLSEVIKKINQSTIENFKKTFDMVRANFKDLYKKFFGGGEADLILTDENNLLESGVDIYAQPPGKKLQNISLCSGGEKALTAVAILFAFFKFKPSPFCILDEVDAPLDDANVGRYNAMVKEFSSKTQFLIVTHNKRTMEVANALYGVTMEEFGVSKIISIRMKNDGVII
ncbi:MAG: chromosome segregation protein SMC [Endomicrobium sp.]|jgi:chromosome segregation protein|nr:chromosome segregation protein SMC [Endomicrobium sp.]